MSSTLVRLTHYRARPFVTTPRSLHGLRPPSYLRPCLLTPQRCRPSQVASNSDALVHEAASVAYLDDLPLPSTRHQPPLPGKDKKARRAEAETLAKDKKLIKVQIGEKGITQNVVDSCLEVLLKHGFVRVKLGSGAGYERKEAQQQLEQLLDSVAVSAVGFTVTFYRQPGLPHPSNYKPHPSSSATNVSSSSSSSSSSSNS